MAVARSGWPRGEHSGARGFSVEAAEGEAAAEGDAGLPQVVDEEETEVARLEALLCDRDVSWPETSVLCDTEVRETLDDSS